MQIGLIGGIGPAATDFYYRKLIKSFADVDQDLDMTIVHADTPTLLGNLIRDNRQAQVDIYKRLTDRLVAAGADCVVVTSIAGHFCIEEFKDISPLPVIDILTEVNAHIETEKLARVGILGTKTVMETCFYGGIKTAEVIPPIGDDLDLVHEAYVTMAASGFASDHQKNIFDKACLTLINTEKVEAIMLGGTDLALVYNEDNTEFSLVDCAAIHVQSIFKRARQ